MHLVECLLFTAQHSFRCRKPASLVARLAGHSFEGDSYRRRENPDTGAGRELCDGVTARPGEVEDKKSQ